MPGLVTEKESEVYHSIRIGALPGNKGALTFSSPFDALAALEERPQACQHVRTLDLSEQSNMKWWGAFNPSKRFEETQEDQTIRCWAYRSIFPQAHNEKFSWLDDLHRNLLARQGRAAEDQVSGFESEPVGDVGDQGRDVVGHAAR